MTPEEIAKELRDGVPWQMDQAAWNELEADIAAALRSYGAACAAEMRETCAYTAESFALGFPLRQMPDGTSYAVAHDDRARTIAAAIRALD